MKNIIAASIIAFGMVASAIIYFFTPKAGRYECKETSDEFSFGTQVFDTALGIYYEDITLKLKCGHPRSLKIMNLKTGSCKSKALVLPSCN